MNSVYVLIILFFNSTGDIQGGTSAFPNSKACESGKIQAEKDFAPIKITTTCIELVAPAESKELKQPTKQGVEV